MQKDTPCTQWSPILFIFYFLLFGEFHHSASSDIDKKYFLVQISRVVEVAEKYSNENDPDGTTLHCREVGGQGRVRITVMVTVMAGFWSR